MKSLIVLILVPLLFACKQNEELNTVKQWDYVENLSEKDILNGDKAFVSFVVDGEDMLLLSKNKFRRVNKSEEIIEERIIDIKDQPAMYKGGFLSKDVYVLSNYPKISSEHKVDSLQFDFYSTEKNNSTKFSIHSNLFPNSEILGYQVVLRGYVDSYEVAAINSNDQIGMVVTSFKRNLPDDRSGIHHLAIFDIDVNSEGVTPTFNRLIDIPELPWNATIFCLKAIDEDFYLTTSGYGTFILKPTGDKYQYKENNRAIYKYNDTIFQFDQNAINFSKNGVSWKNYKTIDYDWVFVANTIDNYVFDYMNGSYGISYSMPDFNKRTLLTKGLPNESFYFMKEFNNKIYAGSVNGGIYSISKSDLF